jgi:hypothetical protein
MSGAGALLHDNRMNGSDQLSTTRMFLAKPSVA